jgi:hypothetical protein
MDFESPKRSLKVPKGPQKSELNSIVPFLFTNSMLPFTILPKFSREREKREKHEY